MEKLNIAELLRDCPTGMELDSTLFEGLEFDCIVDNEYLPIRCRIKHPNGGYTVYNFTKYGCWLDTTFAKCVIFPKGKTTWEGFQRPFKDGDVIFTHANCLKVGVGNTWISIYKENRNGGVATYVDYAEDGDGYYSDLDGDKAFLCMEEDILRQRFATKEEKQKLFDAIKANGYEWNAETKTLEKLIEPKFKVGDRVRNKNYKDYIYDIHDIIDKGYRAKEINADSPILILFGSQEDNYELAPNKFDINTLKPFDNCKYSLDGGKTWKFAQYWYIQDKYNVNDIEIELWQN